MYKVFINDRSLILTDDYSDYTSDYDSLFMIYASEEAFFETITLLKESPVLRSVVIFNKNLEELWKVFCSKYKMIEAAGGIVNNKERILFIYKNNHWDLPKGKIDGKESLEDAALREVKEECGISDLSINESRGETYYTYSESGENILKKTTWFLMTSADEGPLTGDEKEGITEVKWMDKNSWEKDQNNSYPSVINLTSSFL